MRSGAGNSEAAGEFHTRCSEIRSRLWAHVSGACHAGKSGMRFRLSPESVRQGRRKPGYRSPKAHRADDVVYVMRRVGVVLMEQAVLAPVIGALCDELPCHHGSGDVCRETQRRGQRRKLLRLTRTFRSDAGFASCTQKKGMTPDATRMLPVHSSSVCRNVRQSESLGVRPPISRTRGTEPRSPTTLSWHARHSDVMSKKSDPDAGPRWGPHRSYRAARYRTILSFDGSFDRWPGLQRIHRI
jgi:hypothetical protein